MKNQFRSIPKERLNHETLTISFSELKSICRYKNSVNDYNYPKQNQNFLECKDALDCPVWQKHHDLRSKDIRNNSQQNRE